MALAVISCKNDKKTEDTESSGTEASITEISGNFMYYEDAAVFQTKSELYGVIANEQLEDLIIQSEILKSEPSDEVAVVLKVKKSKKPENEEGWENRIEIMQIMKVSKVKPEDRDIIKLESTQ
ncbi:MAG TPA: hypothetical protein VKZ98_05900 [Aquaticitalea sp.]|nr:hypothetical protein [Aquaticitalea sp.]